MGFPGYSSATLRLGTHGPTELGRPARGLFKGRPWVVAWATRGALILGGARGLLCGPTVSSTLYASSVAQLV